VLEQYRFRDAARKVVGVGSVGMRAYIVLMQGRGPDDLLVLQAKEAVSSVLTPYWGQPGYERHWQRVVVGQRLILATSDPFLGWAPFAEGDFYIRRLLDHKGPSDRFALATTYHVDAQLVGGTLARAHARSTPPCCEATPVRPSGSPTRSRRSRWPTRTKLRRTSSRPPASSNAADSPSIGGCDAGCSTTAVRSRRSDR
jgi:hypothetical protein